MSADIKSKNVRSADAVSRRIAYHKWNFVYLFFEASVKYNQEKANIFVYWSYFILQLPSSVLPVSPNAAVVTPSATALTDSLSNNLFECNWIFEFFSSSQNRFGLVRTTNSHWDVRRKWAQRKNSKFTLHTHPLMKAWIVECRWSKTELLAHENMQANAEKQNNSHRT